MKTPRQVEIAITNQCNLRCKYCSHFTSATDAGKDLPKEEWLKFFEELKKMGVMRICLQGGEPFFRNDLKDIILGIVKNNMRFSILSNGTLIDADIASFIASTKRCDSVQVSIDGSNPETHDIMRGKGNFVKSIKGIEILKKYGIPVDVRVTIHKKNIDDLDKIAKLLLEDLGLPSFSTNEACHLGLCIVNAKEAELDIDDLSLAMEKLLKLTQKYKGRILSSAGPLSKAKIWIQATTTKSFLGSGGFLSSCKCPFGKISIRADGIMVPCLYLAHLELGRINKDSLVDVWQNSPKLNKLRERCSIPLSKFESCKDCDYINNCRGDCPASAYNNFGELDIPNTKDCLKTFLEKGGKLPDKKLIA